MFFQQGQHTVNILQCICNRSDLCCALQTPVYGCRPQDGETGTSYTNTYWYTPMTSWQYPPSQKLFWTMSTFTSTSSWSRLITQTSTWLESQQGRMASGVECWCNSSSQYMKEAVNNTEAYIHKHKGKMLSGKTRSPMERQTIAWNLMSLPLWARRKQMIINLRSEYYCGWLSSAGWT
jgi:hypothetical protein